MSEIDPETVGQLLHETARVWRHKLDQRLRPLGLSQAKWRTIAHLARGQMTQRDLAERLSIEEPTLARLAHSPRKRRLDQARERAARSALQNRPPATQVEPASPADRGHRPRVAARTFGNDFIARFANLPARPDRDPAERPRPLRLIPATGTARRKNESHDIRRQNEHRQSRIGWKSRSPLRPQMDLPRRRGARP